MSEQRVAGPVIRRRTAPAPMVEIGADWPDGPLPALVRANVPGVELASWIADNRTALTELGWRHGAVLMRGFEVGGADDFGAAMRALSDGVLSYGERSSPRSEVTDGIYTSTDHPADQPIVLHNEQSYTLNWPLRIVFHCDVAPGGGGRTPLADSRRILATLRPELVAEFDRRGVLYQRNYLPGISLPWQTAFQTESRAEVEAYCAANEIEVEWVGQDQLRTRQARPALGTHPGSGQRSWFNHAVFFHASSLPDQVHRALREALAEEDLPYQTYYGDGAPIPDPVLAELRAAYAAETRAFAWQRGDVLMVENMLVAHGREPYTPPRRILTAMADPYAAAGSAP
ncbi:MAG TPA: TauD/TfdA family dioxygenase [Jatrophihabitans sp.]|nr:TauD/TfdA family dioxygenase [Jatrophihabitans sp.]